MINSRTLRLFVVLATVLGCTQLIQTSPRPRQHHSYRNDDFSGSAEYKDSREFIAHRLPPGWPSPHQQNNRRGRSESHEVVDAMRSHDFVFPDSDSKSDIIFPDPNRRDRQPGPSERRKPTAQQQKTPGQRKLRICERKYAEYVERIFPNENDTIADANDVELDGRELAAPGEYPHMAAVGFQTEENGEIDYKCGGSLISETFVVTVAHCTNFTGEVPTKVRVGDLNLRVEENYLEPQTRTIRKIHRHPKYEANSYYNDIALLEVDGELSFTEFVRPIRLWVRATFPFEIAFAMGYGSTGFGKRRTDRLTDLNMTIVPNDECNNLMPTMPEAPQGIVESLICALDYAQNRDTCQGDSGGPLQLNFRGKRRRQRKHYHLIGITSYGMYCRSGYPSVYTRVSSFIDWIERTAWPLET